MDWIILILYAIGYLLLAYVTCILFEKIQIAIEFKRRDYKLRIRSWRKRLSKIEIQKEI